MDQRPLKHFVEFGRQTPRCEILDSRFILTLDTPKIMGVLNVTPDSFSDGDQYLKLDAALAHAKEMLNDGATIIDVGGESTRPGAIPVSEEEEINRIGPVVEKLAEETDAIISIDTYKPKVARQALEAGAHLVNDISGGRNRGMFELCAEKDVPLVIMHMQGEPLSMQNSPQYENVVSEVSGYLMHQAALAKELGVKSIILDPGIGFGKRLEDNIDLLRHLGSIGKGLYPLLLGASRKKMIQMIEGVESLPVDRDGGSISTHLFGISKGASIIRVHNVRAHAQAIALWASLN